MMFAFRPVLLWTDILVFLLIAGIAWFAWYARGREHLRAPWRKVARSHRGMVAATILLGYVLVGLADSLHFQLGTNEKNEQGGRFSGDVMSLFDLLAEPLRTHTERTFSAPFAFTGLAKETITHVDGSQTRDYPRLRHGGAHLADPARERGEDILSRAFKGLALAAMIWLLVSALLTSFVARYEGRPFGDLTGALWRGAYPGPMRAVLVTLAVMLAVAVPLFVLSGHYHVLGTDKVGQDVFYLTLKSVRTALVIGTVTTLVMLPFALALGIMAGYLRGWVDDIIQYVYTTLNSIPSVLLIAAAVLMMQVYMDTHPDIFDSVTRRADFRLVFLCTILGVTSWTGLCRLLRGETLKLRETEFVQAARAFGVGDLRIMTRHVLPNVFHLVIISTVLSFSGLVLAEAVLSYVGVGVDPAMNSFGTMINAARLEMAREPMVWWPLAAAFVSMFFLVLSANLFADAVRDALDPRTRHELAGASVIGVLRRRLSQMRTGAAR